MSDTDSFIEEVTEEVRRDRLFKLLRRYGWIGVLAVVAIVGFAAFTEIRKSNARADAQDLGDSLIGALASNEAVGRADALAQVGAHSAGGDAVTKMLLAGAQLEAGDSAAAIATLNAVSTNGALVPIYRQIASFKALLIQSDTLDANERRIGYEALAAPGSTLRPLAEEQLALIDIEEGNTEAALERLNGLSQDAEAEEALKQRAIQMIVALGGEPQV